VGEGVPLERALVIKVEVFERLAAGEPGCSDPAFSAAHRNASTTDPKITISPSPVVFTSSPPYVETA
jgi:hypothetical protein